MKVLNKRLLIASILFSSFISTSAWSEDETAALGQRIERLERIIQGQGLVSLLGRVDQLQNEVQRLNGDNESLRHQIETMKKLHREMYLELEQRIEKLSANPVPVLPVIPDASESEATNEQVETDTPTIETPATDITTVPQGVPVAVENGEAAYQAALQTLRSGQYEQAITALEAFPANYPHSSYLPNAYYWKGEAHYVLRNFDQAIVAFTKVVKDFPASSKVADATLKLGFSQYEKGQFDVAKATLESVIKKYPNTSAARLAQVRLDRMNSE